MQEIPRIENRAPLPVPESHKPRLVVAGGGFAGMKFVKQIDHRQYQVVLLDRFNYHTFQPLLYQVATAGLEPDSVAGPLRKIFRKKGDFHFRMVTIREVDTRQKILYTSGGLLTYDTLVLATGSRTDFFGKNDLADHCYPLKQVSHALDLRSRILQQFEKLTLMRTETNPAKSVTFVVVGGGPTGVEVCGSLAELRAHVLPADYPDLDLESMRIVLVEGFERLLPTMSEYSGKRAHRYLERMGVEVVLGTLTESFDGETVRLSNGNALSAETLIWAAGVRGNLIDGIGVDNSGNNRIPVDLFHRVIAGEYHPGHNSDLYAIGDLSRMQTNRYPEGHPGLAAVAIQQGRHLAENLNLIREGHEPTPFQYRDRGVMATIGRNKAVADLANGMHLKGSIGWIAWMFLHLFYMVGFRNKAVILTNWIWNYLTYDRGIRLIIRPSTKENDPVSRELVKEMNETEHKI